MSAQKEDLRYGVLVATFYITASMEVEPEEGSDGQIAIRIWYLRKRFSKQDVSKRF